MQDTWRTVTVDDRIPVDLFGRSLLVNTRPLQLWPLLLSKAILKVRKGGGTGSEKMLVCCVIAAIGGRDFGCIAAAAAAAP